MRRFFLSIQLLYLTGISFNAWSQKQVYTIETNQVQAMIQPTMWGIFFEDINMAADGGLYAELVKNRSFEFATPMMGWKELKNAPGGGTILVLNRSSMESNPRFIRVTSHSDTGYGISNEGFRGMGIRAGESYQFSIVARQNKSSKTRLRIELVNEKNERIGSASLQPSGESWKKYNAVIQSAGTAAKGRLNIWMEGSGVIDLDMISLFPADTWKGRAGGLRKDLVQLLADMKPGFLRFPGGCIVEGRDLATRYQWKKTIGNTDQRKLIINRWNTEFRHRLTPDYFQSFGLGFFEYFQLAEDIGAEPLPILNCGMACQYNTAEVVPTNELDPYLQDALDLIEFANGNTSTKWGAVRAALGHPAPFHLKMMGIGNEQWGPQYIERYRYFASAIKKKYPQIKLVNSVGPDPDGDRFNFLNDTLRKMKADILDEHYYRSPEWFLQNASRYDQYDRKGPKIFAGEYAAQSVRGASPDNRNNWKCALSEGAFMTGLERNADVVVMASYAPLLAHAEGWQWTPDLIWFDNLQSYGTPSYYVQKLFANYKGTHVLPVLQNSKVVAGQDSCYASAVVDRKSGEIIVKLINAGNSTLQRDLYFKGINNTGTKVLITELKSGAPDAANSFDEPFLIRPVEKEASLNGDRLTLDLPPYSFQVIRVKIKG